MTGDARAKNTEKLVIAMLEKVMGNDPFILILEDLHWYARTAGRTVFFCRHIFVQMVGVAGKVVTSPKYRAGD